jgi:hypothetical protein
VFLSILFNIIIYIIYLLLNVIYNKNYYYLTNTYNIFKEERPHYIIKLYKSILGTIYLY